MLQLSVNNRSQVVEPGKRTKPTVLSDLRCGEEGVLESLDVPEDIAHRLMELGFLPGCTVVAARCAPGGDPRVFRVDGAEVALRRETAARLLLRREQETDAGLSR